MSLQQPPPSTPTSGAPQNITGTSPEALAEELIVRWRSAPKNVILSCCILLAAVQEFGPSSPAFASFLHKLVDGKVLSENDALSGFRANGKLSMLKKIGEHAELLLNEALLPLLPPAYSVLYQVALLIERVGFELAKSLLMSLGPGFVREDIINAKPEADSRPSQTNEYLQNSVTEYSELFVVTASRRVLGLLSQSYAAPNALDRALSRPQPAENAGLVIFLPLLAFGVAERELLPLLGFSKVSRAFLVGYQRSADITNHQLIMVAERGLMRLKDLEDTALSDSPLDILAIADRLFPNAHRKCHLFAGIQTPGWHCLIGSENWIEEPTL